MARVYIETTIPSAYWEERTAPEMVARRNWTRRWWDVERSHYEVVTSVAVLDELSRGNHPKRQEKMAMLDSVKKLGIDESVIEIVEVYLIHKVMPSDPQGDALHLALASLHKCDMLLTWNCQHLANANKVGHIQRVNTRMGLMVPQLITPLELLHEDLS